MTPPRSTGSVNDDPETVVREQLQPFIEQVLATHQGTAHFPITQVNIDVFASKRGIFFRRRDCVCVRIYNLRFYEELMRIFGPTHQVGIKVCDGHHWWHDLKHAARKGDRKMLTSPPRLVTIQPL